MLPRPYDAPWAKRVRIADFEDLLADNSKSCGAQAQWRDWIGSRAVPESRSLPSSLSREVGDMKAHTSPLRAVLHRASTAYAWQWDQGASSA
jgi:hypothetical protein